MKRPRRSTRNGRQSPCWDFLDEFDEFEPDPVSVELYRILQSDRCVFMTTLAWYERSLADVRAQFGGGLYKLVVRYRGRVTGTRRFEIWGPPIGDKT